MSTVDFFEGQTRAKKRTGVLVLLFAVAVVLIAVAVFLVVAGVHWGIQRTPESPAFLDWIWTKPELLAAVFAITLAVIGIGTITKLLILRAGGPAVAESLGGRRVPPNTREPGERRLLNVVEEVAIASGVPVPPVYLLEREQGINAFAAGFGTDDAVIGVTRGCVATLNRDELQGVIAHEFSHVLNGDMRMNLRLIGVVHGILLLGLLGYMALRVGIHSGRGRSGKGGGGAMAAILGVGVGLIVIGYVGTFFGRLIKAAVSRQREYLADSSAVQFTRNPGGISGALKKIGGLAFGSRLDSPKAEELSHMYFGQGLKLSSLFATHPPLVERIQRIDPGFDGRFPPVEPSRRPEKEAPKPKRKPKRARVPTPPILPVMDLVGRPAPEHLEFAAALTASLSRELLDAAREPYGARAVIYALILNREEEPRRAQWERLEAEADPFVTREARRLAPLAEALAPETRLPLVDVAVAGLRELSPDQYAAFKGNVEHLIQADAKVELFEWILRKILLRHLEPLFTRVKRKPAQYYSLRPLAEPCGVLLSSLAHAGAKDAAAARKAFELGASTLPPEVEPGFFPPEACPLAALDAAIDRLDEASPKEKRTLLTALATTIAADREVTAAEAELFRAIADALGIPVPPLLPGQPLVS
ncbi:MAG: M48 family metallopeptidase [Planctomycetota bacterium]|jgi:Zn-dependent protease with chaperone function